MASVNELVQLRNFFDTGATRSYEFRLQQLKKLKRAIEDHEKQLYEALYQDLGKSPAECWVTENGFLLSELKYAIKNLDRWMATRKVPTNLLNLPSSSFIIPEPLGVVLIISPWNYPLQLLFNPLVGAIAAGNCMVLKPSEFAPASNRVMKDIIDSVFSSNYVLFTQGDGVTVIPAMMEQFRFDHVFYTGSTAVGRSIYQMAAKQLVPVTLELGGKSPCVVEVDANIKVTARRLILTKFSNAGQMCVAPDYVLVHASRKAELVLEMKKTLQDFFGTEIAGSGEYGKIINTKQFDRLNGYLNQGNIIHGGKTNREALFIEPTLMDEVDLESPLMKEEIFGPILPVIGFENQEEASRIINRNNNPLAFYLFTESKQRESFWLNKVSFGGGCINNASFHLTNHQLPFGGRGNSGIGHYHGKYSFEVFSHFKSILKTPTWLDPSVRYPPYKNKLNFFKWVIR